MLLWVAFVSAKGGNTSLAVWKYDSCSIKLDSEEMSQRKKWLNFNIERYYYFAQVAKNNQETFNR